MSDHDEMSGPAEPDDVAGGTPSLEDRLGRLEEILARMESEEIELEEALALFEEGVTHVRRAEHILAETELKVEELLADGSTRPADVDGE